MDTGINQNNLQKLMDLGDSISFADLLSPAFIAEYTDFETIQELFEQSGYTVENMEDFAAIPDEEWDAFIAKNTRFDSWKAMQIKAFEVFTDNILLS